MLEEGAMRCSWGRVVWGHKCSGQAGSLGRLSRFFVVLCLVFLCSCSGGSPSFVPGEVAPDFTLRDTAGNVRRLSEFRGKVVLLNFWASWCGPCVSELPSLQRLAGRLAERGFVVLGVGVDDDVESLVQFQKVYGLSYPTLVDPDGAVKRTYKLTGVPESFFIDRDGKFILIADPDTNDPVVRIVGPREWDTPTMLSRIVSTLH